METSAKLRTANILRYVARISMLIIGLGVTTFALISGSEAYEEGLMGIVKNSPNALPWVSLLFLTFVAWRKELTGGIIITALGVILTIFFNTGPNFFLSTFILTLSVTFLGIFFIISWFLRRKGISGIE